MRTMTTALVIVLVCGASVQAQVDNCTELLRLTRTTARTVMDRSQFTRTVDNFCNEARTARSDSRSLNVDLRILGIGAGGGSEATTNSAFAKYCSEQSNENRDVLNYQQYLDGIDPGAYAAYDACAAAASTGVVFQLLTPTRDALHLVVSFPTNDPNAQADMSWATIGPVNCQWESFDGDGVVEAAQRRILRADERTRLKCARDSFNSEPIREPDYVNVIRDGGTATINIPWSKYNRQGEPVATLAEIRSTLEETLEDELAAMRRENAELRRELEVFRALERLPLRQRIDADGGSWGTWRDEYMCPERHYVCGIQQRIEGWQRDGDDTAMNGLRMFCCPLFTTGSEVEGGGASR